MRAVILAGGRGIRLLPYTTVIPKPLVPIGNEMPILEIIIRQLRKAGFTRITITVNHLAELIAAFFGDGTKWGLSIDYSIEDEPLSTIGPLTLLNDLPEDFLVMNGDVLCDLDYRELMEFHSRNENKVTVSTFKRESKIDFGVIQYDAENRITGFVEKPVYHFDVSMGIYCINRAVLAGIPKATFYGFDHLMHDGIRNASRFSVKPFSGFWLDIGRPEDYDYCNEHFAEIRGRLGV